VAGSDERLIYRNTQGIDAVNFPANQPVSDDIATTAPDGCNLKSYKFKVLGRVLDPSPSQPPTTGPFTVHYGLYTNCPLAVGTTNALRDLVKIPGTDGVITFPDDAPRAIKHVVDPHNPVAIPNNVYLGLRFDRRNCGTVVGTPAMVGFSGDVWDAPGFPCYGFLNGFPQHPHASFWLEMYGDAKCPASFPGYKNAQASGPIATIGAEVQGVDDIKLQVRGCQMVGYEVVVRGIGFYTFDLRRQCDGEVIAGTERTFQVNASTTPLLQVARFRFDPPVPLPDDDLFLGFRTTSNSSGPILAGKVSPSIGASEQEYFKIGLEGCEPVYPGAGVNGAVNLAINCAGSLPVGACCDMVVPECEGGADEGKRCSANSDCAGGTCESVCREVPEMNCPWPPRGRRDNPAWVEGEVCEPDPFELPCGVAACCKPDDTCENLTKNECNAVLPLERPRLWQMGSYCGQGTQECPFSACLALEGSCRIAHDWGGCSDPFCCESICDRDPWCCHVEWDRECVRLAGEHCGGAGTPINQCLYPQLIGADSTTFFSNRGAGASVEYCCNALDPGAMGFGSTWFKFVATDASVQIDTCESDPEGDSLINLYAVGDPSNEVTACNSISLIGCGDDGCGSSGRHTKLCVDGLTPGVTYYITVAAKTLEATGTYQMQLKSPAQCDEFWVRGDCNQNGRNDGCDLIDGSSADCDANSVPDECEEPAAGRGAAADACLRFGQTIEPETPTENFGASVSLDGEWLFIGNPRDDRDGLEDVGAVHIYRRSGSAWSEFQILKVSCPTASCLLFGNSVAVSGLWAFVVGYEHSPNSGHFGKVYLFRFLNGVWNLAGQLTAPPDEMVSYQNVKIDNDVAAVAGRIRSDLPSLCSAGIVIHLFSNVGEEWQPTSRIPATGSFGECGFELDLRDGILCMVSSEERIDPGGRIEEDSLQIFEPIGGGWRRTARFEFPDGSLSPSVSVRGNMAVVAGRELNVQNRYEAVGYVFARTVEGWKPETVIRNPEVADYYIAHAVAMCQGGQVGMAVSSSNDFCTHARFSQRTIDGNWEGVCDVPFPECFGSEEIAAMSCTNESAAIGNLSYYDGSVFTFSIPSVDCDKNGVVDRCDLSSNAADDCNENFTPDQCEPLVGSDANFSGFVDLSDFAGLQQCFAGGGGSLAACCGVFDAEPDGDADLMDFAAFVGAMTGP
jgi:hypothetical protein